VKDEDALINAILANPEDDELRQVYADWLEERGDPCGEFLRTEATLATLPEKDKRAGKLRARLQEMRARIDGGWLALMDRAPVEGCFQFRVKCPERWEALNTTDNPSVRVCDACRQKVFHCATLHQARRHALRGHCVAVDSRLLHKKGSLPTSPSRNPETQGLVLGMPAPPLPRYRPGQEVTVQRGPHRGIRGEVKEVRLHPLRLTVLLPLATGRTAVELDFEDLDPANARR
jgi:uncharacterized protein (TIGR02996 family)